MSGPRYTRRPARSVCAVIRFQEGLAKPPADIDLAALRRFVKRLNREPELRGWTFDVTLVDDAAIAALNAQFRGTHGPTDVLSFPFQDQTGSLVRAPGFEGFAGDVVISLETARRNAAAERHSFSTELRQLILHGALHLAGFDHETDRGEMNELELKLRQSLQIEGGGDSKPRQQRRPPRKAAGRGSRASSAPRL